MANIFGSKARRMIKSIFMHVTKKEMTIIWAVMVHVRGSGSDEDHNGGEPEDQTGLSFTGTLLPQIYPPFLTSLPSQQ